MKALFRFLLRRTYFKGQYRLFFLLYRKKMLQYNTPIIAKPLKGNFRIYCDTKTIIGAEIYYMGEYEDYIKATFERQIEPGNTVLDIRANIGFHTLFFSELVKQTGKVIAFEPVKYNYDNLTKNIELNNYSNIIPHQLALGNSNEIISINANKDDINPGSFSLFKKGDLKINVVIGDEFINEKVDFIKIDVEGYELITFMGLKNTIQKYKPKIVFEFDKTYQLKSSDNPFAIFELLADIGYIFFEINRDGLTRIKIPFKMTSCDVLALIK